MPAVSTECLQGVVRSLWVYLEERQTKVARALERRNEATHNVEQLELALVQAREKVVQAEHEVETAQEELWQVTHQLTALQWILGQPPPARPLEEMPREQGS